MMTQSIPLLSRTLIVLSVVFTVSTTIFAEPPNLTLVKKEITTYYESGLYQHELTQKIKQAQEYIIEQALINQNRKEPQKLALVLDIDETSLSNYEKMAKRGFLANREQIHQEIMAADAPVIKPMLELYNNALNHGIKIFFVTGRNESERNATQTNLINAGYTQWSGLYLRPDEYNQQSIIPFKSQSREKITNEGYTVIASIGDQYSDIRGGYAEKGFKLPNPFYYLP